MLISSQYCFSSNILPVYEYIEYVNKPDRINKLKIKNKYMYIDIRYVQFIVNETANI